MAKKKAARERIVGSVKEIDVGHRTTGAKRAGQPVVLKVRTRTDGSVQEDWIAVSKKLKVRVRELAVVPEELVGHTFEFALNEFGQIVAMARIAK